MKESVYRVEEDEEVKVKSNYMKSKPRLVLKTTEEESTGKIFLSKDREMMITPNPKESWCSTHPFICVIDLRTWKTIDDNWFIK